MASVDNLLMTTPNKLTSVAFGDSPTKKITLNATYRKVVRDDENKKILN